MARSPFLAAFVLIPLSLHLAERWSKIENVEWLQEIPGTRDPRARVVVANRNPRQAYVTTVTTDGEPRPRIQK